MFQLWLVTLLVWLILALSGTCELITSLDLYGMLHVAHPLYHVALTLISWLSVSAAFCLPFILRCFMIMALLTAFFSVSVMITHISMVGILEWM